MMKNIIDKINSIDKVYHVDGCSTSQLKTAQKELGIVFPDEFTDYVKSFGVISFYGTEWTGLNVEGYLNVVEATLEERKLNEDFPLDCFVIENQAIDGLVTAVNEKGEVLSVQYGRVSPLCKSLSDYLDICIARRK